jgi:Protein of unknown function (DUF1761)
MSTYKYFIVWRFTMTALGIVVAATAAFVISAVYYGALPAPAPAAQPSAPRSMASTVIVEMVRNLAVAALVAGLLAVADWNGLGAGALLGVSLWTLPVVLLAGSVFHEGVAVRRAALHSVDWLIKLVVIGAIIGIFR